MSESRSTPARSLIPIAIVAMIAALAAGALAQPRTGRIEGTVHGVEGEALARASVQLLGAQLYGGILGTLSDADGRFAFAGLPAGTYALRVSYLGYVDRTRATVGLKPGASIDADLEMQPDPLQLSETVVTAGRARESIMEAAASIARVDAAELQRDAVATAYMGAVRNTPGIDHFQTSILEERVNARGYNSAFNYRMVVLVDGRLGTMPSLGLPMNVQTPVADSDVESVEVLVGPGSALYGADATSGVISVTTKDPREYPGTQLSLGGGSRSTARGSVRHAGYRGPWAWKLAGQYLRAHDYERVDTYFSPDSSLAQPDDPDFDASVWRGQASLQYNLSAERRLQLDVGTSTTNAIAVTSLGRAQVQDMQFHYEHLSYRSPSLYLGIYQVADDWGTTHMLGTKAQAMLAGLPEAAAKDRAFVGGRSALWDAEARYRFGVDALRGTEVDVGVNLRQFRPDTDGKLLNDADRRIRLEQTGIFGQTRTALTEQLRLDLAARLDDHEVYGARLSPKAALIYRAQPNLVLRASYNQAYQSPSLGNQEILVRFSDLIVARGNGKGFQFANLTGGPLPEPFASGIPKLKPEENTTWEVGLRGVLGERIFVDLAGYHSRYRNFISPATPINDLANGIVTVDEDGNPRREVTLTYLNFGRQTVNGLDLTASTYFRNKVNAHVGLSLIDAGTLKASTGLEQPFNTPERIYTAGVSARDQWAAGSTADLSLRHVSEYDFSSGVYIGTVPAYTVVDLNLGYALGDGIGLRLTAKNLLGNRHREFIGGPKLGRMVVSRLEYSL